MSLSDQVLDLVLSFLFERKDGKTDGDLRLAALPVYKLLQTRRMRGFDHVKLELCRKGLQWAMRAKEYWMGAALTAQMRLARPTMDRYLTPGQLYLEQFRDPSNSEPENAADPDVVRYL